jgi:methylmalonyl-CoA mutase N-terminal domain/subunit
LFSLLGESLVSLYASLVFQDYYYSINTEESQVDVLCIDNSLVKQKQLDRITWVRESRDKKMVKTLVFIITKINIRYKHEEKKTNKQKQNKTKF